jgi:hypothetical protein
MESNTKVESSMRCQTTNFSLAFHRALEYDAQGIHERLNAKNAFGLQLLAAKVGG